MSIGNAVGTLLSHRNTCLPSKASGPTSETLKHRRDYVHPLHGRPGP